MTPAQAAKVIGCSPSHVRHLIRTKQIRATKVVIPGGYYWDVIEQETKRYRDTPQLRGYPRGKPRNNTKGAKQ